MDRPFNTIGIVGVGLIGGSLGLALKRIDSAVRIHGIGRDVENLKIAQHMGAVDSYAVGPDKSLNNCDLVILATPVEQIRASLQTLGDRLSSGTLVTDVGSTKRSICEQAWNCLPSSVEFIGGHPVAGREVSGVENSLANLFEHAPYVLCPRPGCAPTRARTSSSTRPPPCAPSCRWRRRRRRSRAWRIWLRASARRRRRPPPHRAAASARRRTRGTPRSGPRRSARS